ncbi:protein S100-A12 [Carlito syrichta]|uniref:Protein S100 n=1 Tax=Carlito syrichta TaxID=1868482 RepID=A0A1U7U862_CARSF|nr:protein S100-A12 [Carlito syrichta]
MSKLEEHMEGIINIFHQYSVRGGHYDRLEKGEMKLLLTKELSNTLKNTRDQATVDRIFQGLDTDRNQQVDFPEFVALIASMLETTHGNIHKE